MLFRRKDGLVRAFIDAYPKGVAVSSVAKDLPKLVEVEWVDYVVNGVKRKVWARDIHEKIFEQFGLFNKFMSQDVQNSLAPNCT